MIIYACLGTAHEYHCKVLAKIEQETVLFSFVDIDINKERALAELHYLMVTTYEDICSIRNIPSPLRKTID